MRSHPSTLLSRRQVLAGLGAAGVAFSAPSFAETYPSHAIKLVVGYAAGGSVDVIGRIVADLLAAKLGSAVIVENQAGAAGAIGALRVARSPADGYTLLAGSSNELAATITVNPAQKYDPRKDFTPIALVATAPVLLVASANSQVKNLDQFFDRVKKNPGKCSYGTSGVGSLQHFVGELIKQRAGVTFIHAPYRSGGALVSDLVGGAVDFAGLSPTIAAPFLQDGRMVALGVSSASRWPGLPQVPSLGEHPLLKGFDLSGWFALAGPRNIPSGIVQHLRAELQAGLQDPVVRRRLQENGALPATGSEDMAHMIDQDVARYATLVKFANIRE